MMEELRKQKYSYEQGVWNPNTVFLGGLGNEPELDENVDPLAQMRKGLEKSRPKSKRVQLFKGTEKDESDEELVVLIFSFYVYLYLICLKLNY